jgi:hypothetical protein
MQWSGESGHGVVVAVVVLAELVLTTSIRGVVARLNPRGEP